MKRILIFLFVYALIACSKKDKNTNNTITPLITEDSIKFSTNLDTGTYIVSDTLPLTITLNSKLPNSGIRYTIQAVWQDSSKEIIKIDTSLNKSILNINIPGFKKLGTYSIAITLTSISRSTNSLTKTINVINNPIFDFQGYKVNISELQVSKERDNGNSYWENLPIPTDLFVGLFQKGVKILTGPYGNGKYEYASTLFAVTLGDFNNDGWIDIFNAGGACNGKASNLTFLIWNPTSKIFEEKNLIIDGTNFIGGPTRAIPIYLNSDDYVDVVIIGHEDECAPGYFTERCKLLLSDGSGRYSLTELILEPTFLHSMFGYELGSIGKVNNDNYQDLILASNTHTYIFWGTPAYPYFTNQNFAHFASDTVNFNSNNGFGEVVPEGSGSVFRAWAKDINNDGKNDLLLGTSENAKTPNRFLTNLGNGRFNQSAITDLPVRNINNAERIDYIVDDLNGDGFNDLVGLDCIYSQSGAQSWELVTYIQKPNNQFAIDKSWIEYTINANNRPNSKWKLVYADYNKDGKKDIGFIDSGFMPTLDPTNDMKKKTVFIRSGSKFIETDFYQFDKYAKYLFQKYF